MDLFDQFDDHDDVPEPERGPLSVTALTAQIRTIVESTFDAIEVEGEISNCRKWSSGHLYFTLKDEHAQVRAVMFRTTLRTLKLMPEDGMHVVIRGRISVYDAKGEYQLICDTLALQGRGARQAAFEALKRKLHLEGLFDTDRKRPLPVLPRRIGVVTSLDGAAVRDIVRVLTSRFPGVRVVVRGTRVQGDGAADDLVRGLAAITRVPDVDVVIIGRGGGSAEDLWAFNDERLARSIAACPVPVISAVGHEVDFTIADFVADLRAATPSNAAELVVDRADAFFGRIDRAERRLRSALALNVSRRARTALHADARLRRWPARLAMSGRTLTELDTRLARATTMRVARMAQRLGRVRAGLDASDVRRVTHQLRTRWAAADAQLRQVLARRTDAAARRAATLAAQLDALSPLAVLGRGYAVCWNAKRDAIIRSAAATQPGDTVHVTLHEGEITCAVRTSNL